jgi:sugar-specific transcriptional regulator TrmB
MSLERVIEALIGLGLSRLNAEVYVCLAQKGPQTAVDLARVLNCRKQKIYPSLKNLQTKDLISKDCTMFTALPFQEALESLIKRKKDKAQAIQNKKEELIATWETKDHHGS